MDAVVRERMLDMQWAQHHFYIACLTIATHLGLPVTDEEYDVMRDPVVLDYLRQSVEERIKMETQQIAELDRDSENRVTYLAQLGIGA